MGKKGTGESLKVKFVAGTKRHKEAAAKGGRVTAVESPKKRLHLLEIASQVAKCKKCKLNCVLKKDNLKQDKEMVCPVPEARGKAMFYSKPVMSVEILERIGDQALYKLMQMAKTPRDIKMVHEVAMKEKEYYAPSKKKIEVEAVKPLWVQFQEEYLEYKKEE